MGIAGGKAIIGFKDFFFSFSRCSEAANILSGSDSSAIDHLAAEYVLVRIGTLCKYENLLLHVPQVRDAYDSVRQPGLSKEVALPP